MSNRLARRQLLQTGIAFVTGAASLFLCRQIAPALAQSTSQSRPTKKTLHTQGRYLYDSSGQKTILCGINLPLLDDWDFPKSDKLAELEKTAANTVRVEWYKDYGQLQWQGITLDPIPGI